MAMPSMFSPFARLLVILQVLGELRADLAGPGKDFAESKGGRDAGEVVGLVRTRLANVICGNAREDEAGEVKPALVLVLLTPRAAVRADNEKKRVRERDALAVEVLELALSVRAAWVRGRFADDVRGRSVADQPHLVADDQAVVVEGRACAALSSSLMTRHVALPSAAGGAQAMPLMSVARFAAVVPQYPARFEIADRSSSHRQRRGGRPGEDQRGKAGDDAAQAHGHGRFLMGRDGPQRWRAVGGSGIHGPDLVQQFGLLKIAACRFRCCSSGDAGGRQQECAASSEEIVFL